MLFGTSHDALNDHGPGLSGLAATLTTQDYLNALVLGVDQNGNAYVKAGNNYYSTLSDLYNAYQAPFRSGAAYDAATQGGLQLVWDMASQLASQIPGAGTRDPISNTLTTQTLASAIGAVRAKYPQVTFYAYVPPPAPTISPSITVQPIGPAIAPAFNGASFESLYGISYTTNDIPLIVNGAPAPVDHVQWFISVSPSWHPGIRIISRTKAYLFAWLNNSWVFQDEATAAVDHYESTVYPVSASIAPPPTVTIPPGYSEINLEWAPRAYPLYASNPTFSNGVTSFTGSKTFNGLVPPYVGAGGNYVGFDPQKLALGIYAVKETDLGPIQSAAGRTYELFMLQFVDTSSGADMGTFYETTEGGGGGLLISDPLALVSRIITDVSTLGNAEILRAAAQKAGVPDSTINLATEAYAAAAVIVATVGVATAVSAPTVAASVPTAGVEGVTESGITTIAASTPEVTAGVGGAVTASGATATEIGATAGTSTILTAAESAGAAVAAKVALPIGLSALSAEIKKLTGQLPGAKPPSQAGNLTINAAQTPMVTPASNPIVSWGLGILAAVAILKKKSG